MFRFKILKQISNGSFPGSVCPLMETISDTKGQELHLRRPDAGNMLADADRLNEQSLGRPLNLMCSLYYEVSLDEPCLFPAATGTVSPHGHD